MPNTTTGTPSPAATTERIPNAPVSLAPPDFFLRATQRIETPRRVILPGQLLHIDPTIQPAEGRMVVVGNRLELWAGQDNPLGVLVAVMTFEDGETEGGEQ